MVPADVTIFRAVWVKVSSTNEALVHTAKRGIDLINGQKALGVGSSDVSLRAGLTRVIVTRSPSDTYCFSIGLGVVVIGVDVLNSIAVAGDVLVVVCPVPVITQDVFQEIRVSA